jgi:hypothetical protein
VEWVQPDAVAVMLGLSGMSVMLQQAEDGSYWIGETAIESGGMHTADSGSTYTLTMGEDGMWMAAYQAPPGIEVMLGDHGGTVIITMTEDGKYFIGEMEIMADSMVMGENGQYYTPGLDEEGMWVAMWVMPDGRVGDAGRGRGDAGRPRRVRDAAVGRGRHVLGRRDADRERRHGNWRKRPLLHPHDGRRGHVDGRVGDAGRGRGDAGRPRRVRP